MTKAGGSSTPGNKSSYGQGKLNRLKSTSRMAATDKACGRRFMRISSSSSLGLGLLWGRDSAYLLHHAQSVIVVPGFCDLTVGNAVDGRPHNRNPIARGADAHKIAFVGATSHPARCYPVSLGYLILDLNVDVGEGRAVHASELLQVFAAMPLLRHGRIVVYVLFRDDFVYHIQVACAEDLLEHAASQCFVLLGHSLCSFLPLSSAG